jgi:hypothetical protein
LKEEVMKKNTLKKISAEAKRFQADMEQQRVLNLTPEQKEEIKRASDREWEARRKAWAVDAANEYFNEMQQACKRMAEDIANYQRNFNEAIEQTATTGMKTQPHNYLEWAAHRMQQIDMKNDKGMRAMAKVVSAFEIKEW